MSELLNGIFECLDINSSTGLATKDSLQNMTPFQRLFYTQVHEKICTGFVETVIKYLN